MTTLRVASETVKQGHLIPVTHDVKWVKRPVDCVGVLSIAGTLYHVTLSDVSDGPYHWQIVDLRCDDKHYRLTYGPDGEHCDCGHASFRACRCKHIGAVKVALQWLEVLERAEWAAGVARRDIAAMNDVPF